MTAVGEILTFLEGFAPPSLAEGWDNIGLMTGDRAQKVNRVLCALDVTEGVVQEAVDGGEVCAALRFGHGEDTMPLSVILEVADPYYDREDSAPIAATKFPACRT